MPSLFKSLEHVMSIPGGFNELSRAGQCVNAKSEKTGDRLDAHSSRGA